MLMLGKTIVLCSCAVAQASIQAHQLFRRYYNGEARYPRTFDPLLHDAESSIPRADAFSEKITYTPSSLPTTTDSAPRLSPAAKAGIITTCVVVFFLVFFLALELAYLGRQRRARAVQQAQREIEQGDVELDNVKRGREIKENVVLESQVEIVVGGEEEVQGSSGKESWGKRWEEEEEANGEVGAWGRERRGMSLQRREY